MKNQQKSYNYIEDYLSKIRAKGRYAFTYQELIDAFKVTPETLDQRLYHLKARKLIALVKKGFYVILPPEYTSQGVLPAGLFIDDLMKSLNKLQQIMIGR